MQIPGKITNMLTAAGPLLLSLMMPGAQVAADRQPELERLLRDLASKNVEVSTRAADSLGKLGDPRAADPLARMLRAKARLRYHAALALARLHDVRALDTLVATLRWSYNSDLNAAFVQIGRPAIPRLLTLARDRQEGTRCFAVTALAGIDIPTALQAGILRQEDAYARQCALEALGSNPHPEATEALVTAAKESSGRDRVAALSTILLSRGWPVLVSLANDAPDPELRAAAAAELSSIDEPEELIRLVKLARDNPTPAITRNTLEALNSLTELGGARAKAVLTDKDVRLYLLATIRDPQPEARVLSFQTLGRMQGAADWKELLPGLADSDTRVRKTAAQALAASADAGIQQALRAALDRRDLPVLAGAYAYFIRLGLPGSEEILIQALAAEGDALMADYFLNSQNNKLYEAAEKWAAAHSYFVKTNNLWSFPAALWGRK